jgi:hypothetical protein
LVLRLGTRWGIAIGIWWIALELCVVVIPHDLVTGIGFMLALVAFLLPFGSGSHGALKTGRMRDGIGICFWSGLISGVMTFPALLAIGYILHDSDVFDSLFEHLFFIHGALNLICGTIGSCAAILLERTGRGPEEPPVWESRK